VGEASHRRKYDRNERGAQWLMTWLNYFKRKNNIEFLDFGNSAGWLTTVLHLYKFVTEVHPMGDWKYVLHYYYYDDYSFFFIIILITYFSPKNSKVFRNSMLRLFWALLCHKTLSTAKLERYRYWDDFYVNIIYGSTLLLHGYRNRGFSIF